MKISRKERNETFLKILKEQVRRHNILIIVILSIILVMNVGNTLGWYYSPDDVSLMTETIFYIAQSAMFFITAIIIALLVIQRFDLFKEKFIAGVVHFYAFFLITWGTSVFCLDLTLGYSPVTYLIVVTFVAGIFTIDPFFFAGLELLSLIPISITIATNPSIFFGGDYLGENIALFAGFLLLTGIITFRNYRVLKNEYKYQQRLEELSYKDELTGLLNERSYVNFTEEINNKIDAGEDVKFAIILMDVNNLKATNDKYGHRFGCSLVVRCGHTLPTILPTSKLFHVGGDEFVAIVMGEDFDNFEETMKKFDEAMLYSIVNYEGVDLIFSVARGYHIREEGQHYKDVLQVADDKMYENKKYLKEKYNMKGR